VTRRLTHRWWNRPGSRSQRWALALALALAAFSPSTARGADPPLPDLTQPVNDFAHVIDGASAQKLDQLIRTLKAASADVVVVATVPTIEPYADIREYAVKLFENHGRGIGDKGKDNGVLILLALKERKVWIEVGYGLEQWITDGYSGETSREYMAPEFRNGRYGAGLLAGTARIVGRIAQGRNVTLTGVQVPVEHPGHGTQIPPLVIIVILIAIFLFSRLLRPPGPGMRGWGGAGWSGWSSGVGPFGGGSGGGFGGGFGGFGGGGSGGGGGGAGW
jgi:uncharacterized protein